MGLFNFFKKQKKEIKDDSKMDLGYATVKRKYKEEFNKYDENCMIVDGVINIKDNIIDITAFYDEEINSKQEVENFVRTMYKIAIKDLALEGYETSKYEQLPVRCFIIAS